MMGDLKQSIKILLRKIFTFCAQDMDVLAEPGPVLVVAPHPDDESLGCGATIARLRSAGQKVRIVVVTDGSAAMRPDIMPPDKLAAERRAETLEAARALNVPGDEIVFLNFPDGRSDTNSEAIEEALARQIREWAPRRVFSPYGVDQHKDHRAIAAAVDRLWRRGAINGQVYEYPIWFWSREAVGELFQPSRLGRLRRVPTQNFLASKKTAIEAHRSQYRAPAGDPGRFTFPPGFLAHFLTPYELFFEKPAPGR